MPLDQLNERFKLHHLCTVAAASAAGLLGEKLFIGFSANYACIEPAAAVAVA